MSKYKAPFAHSIITAIATTLLIFATVIGTTILAELGLITLKAGYMLLIMMVWTAPLYPAVFYLGREFTDLEKRHRWNFKTWNWRELAGPWLVVLLYYGYLIHG